MQARHLLFPVILAALSHIACVAPTEADGEDAVSQAALEEGRANTEGFVDVPDLARADVDAILAKYADVPHPGVREELYENAILYYETNLDRIPNRRWLSILDFSKHSKNRRFFVLDMEGGPMASYVVSHGKKSDPNDDGIATMFSNVNGSNMSSIGYYLTAETYIGSNGRSLRLDGLSSTNSNARERLVVIHGANYVEEGRDKQGLSLGCPAFSHSIVQGLIDKLREGSIIYASN